SSSTCCTWLLGGAATRSSVCTSMRSISASTCAISCRAADESVVLLSLADIAAVARMAIATAREVFLTHDLVSRNSTGALTVLDLVHFAAMYSMDATLTYPAPDTSLERDRVSLASAVRPNARHASRSRGHPILLHDHPFIVLMRRR